MTIWSKVTNEEFKKTPKLNYICIFLVLFLHFSILSLPKTRVIILS